jgi:hypothetical protein
MNAAAFFDDMFGFLRRGEIGDVASLETWPEHPEIGTQVHLVCRGVQGVLRCSDGRQWLVVDGSRLRVSIDSDWTFWLCDDAGRIQVQKEVHPQVAVPRLLDWNLPAHIDYAQALRIEPRMSECQELALTWRRLGEPDWLPVPEAGLHLPPQPDRVEIRARMRSRHAGLHPLASAEEIKLIEIWHPKAIWRLDAPLQIHRHDRVELRLVSQWVRSATLSTEGRSVRRGPGAADRRRSTAALAVATDQVGPVQLSVRLQGLDGRQELHELSLNVLARPVRCDWRAQAEGVAYELHNAQPLRLEVPSRGLSLPVTHVRGLITHACVAPTEARLIYRDDCDVEGQAPLVLKLPAPAWPEVPTIPPVYWA